MDPKDVLLQTALVFGAMRAVRAALCRILAALDLQVILHIPQPAVTFTAPRAPEATRFLVEITGPSLRRLRICRMRVVRDLGLTDGPIWMIILVVTRPRYYTCKKIKYIMINKGTRRFLKAHKLQRYRQIPFLRTFDRWQGWERGIQQRRISFDYLF